MDLDPEKAAVVQAAEARARALVTQNSAALRELMHEQCRWITYAGLVLDRDDYIDRNTSRVHITAQSFEAPEVRIVGRTAVLTTVVNDEFDGQPFRLRLTMTWVKEADRWRLLAAHAGPKLNDQPAGPVEERSAADMLATVRAVRGNA